MFAMGSGVFLYIEGQKTYDALLRKEDEYVKAAVEMSVMNVDQATFSLNYGKEGEGKDSDWTRQYMPRSAAGQNRSRIDGDGQMEDSVFGTRQCDESGTRQAAWAESCLLVGLPSSGTESSYGKKMSSSTASYM